MLHHVKHTRFFELTHFEKNVDLTKAVIVGIIQISIMKINIQNILLCFGRLIDIRLQYKRLFTNYTFGLVV